MTSMSDLHADLMVGGKWLLDNGQDEAAIEKFAFNGIYTWVALTLMENQDPGAPTSVDIDWIIKQAKAVTNQITGEYHVGSSADIRRSKLGADHPSES